jgi:environmental stress-induced protein Ves
VGQGDRWSALVGVASHVLDLLKRRTAMRDTTNAARPSAASDLRIIPPDAWCWVPWRNGQGRTVELHMEGDPQKPDWRLSLAVIDGNAPFSAWTGFERELVLLRGGPLQLSTPGERWTLKAASDRAHFPGEAQMVADAETRATVVNLMVRRDSVWRLASVAPIVRIAHALAETRLRVGDQALDLASGATLIVWGGAAIAARRGDYVSLGLGSET